MSRTSKPASCILAIALAALALSAASPQPDLPPGLKTVTVSDGVELHYMERGSGVPVIFVHGSLSDGGYWSDVVGPFGEDHRVVAYSRRYNFPNTNPIQTGYSAVVDADDLAALINKLALGPVHVVGHSYGALTALFLAVRHPELVRTLVLAEAPAVSLLADLHDSHDAGKATLADIQTRMVKPMRAAFQKGDRDAGVGAFMAYIFNDPQAWEKMSESSRRETLKNAREWDAMLVSGELFPTLDPRAVRRIQAPVLLLSGEKSYPFLALIDAELQRLLPHCRRVVVRGATHQMWLQQPEVCRKAVMDFWRTAATDPK